MSTWSLIKGKLLKISIGWRDHYKVMLERELSFSTVDSPLSAATVFAGLVLDVLLWVLGKLVSNLANKAAK